jgi:hypothetical protein
MRKSIVTGVCLVAPLLAVTAGGSAAPKAAPEHAEVLFMGPSSGNAVLYNLIFSYLVESGVYLETDAQGRVPEKLPADLSGFKVIIVNRNSPVMQDEAARKRLEEFAQKGGGVITHTPPAAINWSTNDPELYDVFDAVTKKYGVRTQNPAFLKRNAARPDKDVILTCAEFQASDPGMARWYAIGNDVAYMHFEGLLKSAALYGRDDLRQFVLGQLASLAETKPQAPVFSGHLLTEYQQPGFEPYLKLALAKKRSLEAVQHVSFRPNGSYGQALPTGSRRVPLRS